MIHPTSYKSLACTIPPRRDGGGGSWGREPEASPTSSYHSYTLLPLPPSSQENLHHDSQHAHAGIAAPGQRAEQRVRRRGSPSAVRGPFCNPARCLIDWLLSKTQLQYIVYCEYRDIVLISINQHLFSLRSLTAARTFSYKKKCWYTFEFIVSSFRGITRIHRSP